MLSLAITVSLLITENVSGAAIFGLSVSKEFTAASTALSLLFSSKSGIVISGDSHTTKVMQMLKIFTKKN
jgi:hypothetical protein